MGPANSDDVALGSRGLSESAEMRLRNRVRSVRRNGRQHGRAKDEMMTSQHLHTNTAPVVLLHILMPHDERSTNTHQRGVRRVCSWHAGVRSVRTPRQTEVGVMHKSRVILVQLSPQLSRGDPCPGSPKCASRTCTKHNSTNILGSFPSLLLILAKHFLLGLFHD